MSQQHTEPQISGRTGLSFPTGRVWNDMKCKMHEYDKSIESVSPDAAVYLTAVIEYILAEVLELSGNACRRRKKYRIQPQDIYQCIYEDDELQRLCTNNLFKSIPQKEITDRIKQHKAKIIKSGHYTDNDIWSEKYFGTMRR